MPLRYFGCRIVQAELPGLVRAASRAAALELADQDGEEVAAELPAAPSYTMERLLDEDWWPEERGGAGDFSRLP